MKQLLLFVLLTGLAATSRAQGIRPTIGNDVFRPLPTLSTSEPSTAPWGLAVPLERPRRGPLLVVNGQPLPDSVDPPAAEDIIRLRELEPAEAVKLYGPRARHGVLLIETEKHKRPAQQ